MNASTSLPTSIHLKPTRLAGLLLAAAALSAVITWVLLVFVVNGSNDEAPLSASARPSGTFPQDLSVRSPTERAYVEAVDKYLREGTVLYGPIYASPSLPASRRKQWMKARTA
jgi:hypothetical protein